MFLFTPFWMSQTHACFKALVKHGLSTGWEKARILLHTQAINLSVYEVQLFLRKAGLNTGFKRLEIPFRSEAIHRWKRKIDVYTVYYIIIYDKHSMKFLFLQRSMEACKAGFGENVSQLESEVLEAKTDVSLERSSTSCCKQKPKTISEVWMLRVAVYSCCMLLYSMTYIHIIH